ESLGPPIQTAVATGPMARKVKHIIDKTLTENPGDWLNMKLPALDGPHCSRPWALVLKSLAQGSI
ncbi:MAG: hypothetical protein Q8P44_06610, partial [Dehalococcoidia bacterium]|nr:hypothetical protein [Dehalococcoidia bacterium]